MSYLIIPSTHEHTLITVEGSTQFDPTSYRAAADGELIAQRPTQRETFAAVLRIIPTARPATRDDNPACTLDYFDQLDWAYALGQEYGRNGLNNGDELRAAPLSGEWADDITPRDVFALVVGRPADEDTESDDVDQFADSWEDGYNSAATTIDDDDDQGDDDEPHTGHYSQLGGTYWCDTCNSPYCEQA